MYYFLNISKNSKNFWLTIFLLQTFYSPLIFSATYEADLTGSSNLFDGEPFKIIQPEIDPTFFTTPDNKESKKGDEIQSAKTHILKAVEFLNQGDAWQSEQELDKAQDILSQSLSKKKNIPALNGLATIAVMQSNNKVALSYVEQSLRLEDNPNALKIKAKVFSKIGKHNEAEQLYLRILQRTKYDSYIYLTLTDLAIKQNNKQKAEYYLLEYYHNSPEEFKQKMRAASFIGRWYSKNKQYDKLISLAEELQVKFPYQTESQLFMVSAQVAADNYKEAERILLKIINNNNNNNNNVSYRLLLTKLLIKQNGRNNDVLKIFDDIIEASPDSPKPYVMKINYLIKLQQYDLVEITIKKLENNIPKSLIAKELRGNVFLAQNKRDQAVLEYKKAYQQRPNKELLFKIILLTNESGNYLQAIKLLKDELDKNDENPILYYYLAEVYQNTGDNQRAVVHYKKVLELEPNNFLALNNLAGIYSQQNNLEAIVIAEKAYNLLPSSPDIADTYASILMKQGSIKEAVSILEKAINQAPDSKEIQYHLAEGYSQINLITKAKEILVKILDNSTQFKSKENAQKLLNQLNSSSMH